MQRLLLQIYAVLLVTVTVTATVQVSDVTFYLFSQNADEFVKIDSSNALEHVNVTAKVIFLIHGWSENRTTRWFHNLTSAFFKRGDKPYNIIQVDYAPIANEIYPAAVAHVPEVGAIIAQFVADLVNGGVELENVEVCGHSLGGQVSGFVGKFFTNKTSRQLPRITALDPAGPLFSNSSDQRLIQTDAGVVFVIHTDRGIWGYSDNCGTIDVFPNNGYPIQPGCPKFKEGEFLFCSHHMSYWFYIYAVAHPKSLFAARCRNYDTFLEKSCRKHVIDIGGDVTADDKGSYYLVTKKSAPYRLKP